MPQIWSSAAADSDDEDFGAEPTSPTMTPPMRRRRPSVVPNDVVEAGIILFAVPKKGRTFDDASKLLKGAGLNAKRPERLDVAMCKDIPVKLVFLPAADIPFYVMRGHVHMGITGSDMLEEALAEAKIGALPFQSTEVQVLQKLGFGRCKLCVQAPNVLNATDPGIFVGKRIVTSFPHITRQYFDNLEMVQSLPMLLGVSNNDANCEKSDTFHENAKQRNTMITSVSGSVEAACGLGLADAIVDLVETGTTMRAAGLEIVSTVLETEALLIQQLPTDENGLKGKRGEIAALILKRIQGYLTSTLFTLLSYNCPAEKLAQCCSITPGQRAPTIGDLQQEGWHMVSALVAKDKVNAAMDSLLQCGAEHILCTDLANTRM